MARNEVTVLEWSCDCCDARKRTGGGVPAGWGNVIATLETDSITLDLCSACLRDSASAIGRWKRRQVVVAELPVQP
jgi:hypothetical protein